MSLLGFDTGAASIIVTHCPPQFEFSYSNQTPDFKAVVSFWMPGYSKDRRTAAVRLGYGPLRNSRHAATGTYSLSKGNGVWRIEWAEFLEYP